MKLKRGFGCLLLGMCVSIATADSTVLNATQANRLLSFNPNSNDSAELIATYNESGNHQNTLLTFDLSSLAGDTITSATLMLYGKSFDGSTTASTVSLYRVVEPWSTTESTWTNYSNGNPWTNPGGDALGTTGSQLTDPYAVWSGNQTSSGAWYNFDVTNLVGQMTAGAVPNNGFLLTAPVGNHLAWVSWNGGGSIGLGLPAANVPELDITYTPAAPEPVGVLALAGSVAVLARRRQKRT